jgi:hypothetical protein
MTYRSRFASGLALVSQVLRSVSSRTDLNRRQLTTMRVPEFLEMPNTLVFGLVRTIRPA